MSGFTVPQPSRVSANPEQADHFPGDPMSVNGSAVERGEDDDMGSNSDHNTEQPAEGTGDVHHALTSQSLNSDGTPKRPMNAFMIFARRRRPQVSAANQMMRTGEISKILSKEWNSMPMSEKQFYLDQAKKLKDNFNSKYPDYVYRRRPNNSRRKRRSDSSGGQGRNFDSSTSADHHDDGSASTEFSGESPVDMPSLPPQHANPLSLSETGNIMAQQPPPGPPHLPHQSHPHIYTRPFPPAGPGSDHAVSPTYDPGPASASSHSSTSSYSYPAQTYQDDLTTYHPPHSAGSIGSASSRLAHSHIPWHESPSSGPSPASIGPSHSPSLEPLHTHHHYQTHPEPTSHLSHPHAHSPDDQPSHNMWGTSSLTTSRFDPTGRTSAGLPAPSASAGPGPGASSGWPMPPSLASVTGSGRPRSLTGSTIPGPSVSTGGSKPELFSPAIPHRAWSNTPSSGSSASATSTTGPGASGMQFQTLTAPFFPNQPSASGDVRSSSTSPTVSRDPYYGSGNGAGRGDGGYEQPHSAYPISPISPPHSGSYFAGGGGNGSTPHLYPPSHGQRVSHLLHPIQTYNSGPHGHGGVPSPRDLASPLSAGPHSAVSHTGYWDRMGEGR